MVKNTQLENISLKPTMKRYNETRPTSQGSNHGDIYMTTPQFCKKCTHNKSDHMPKQKMQDGIVLRQWYGECRMDLCMCEEFEQEE